MTLTSSIQVILASALVGDNDFATPTYTLNYRKTQALASGVGANQADKIFADQRTLAASANEDLDLAGVLLDPFGNVLGFAKVKSLLIVAATGNTNNVLVKPAASNGWNGPFSDPSDQIVIKPGGMFLVTAPNAAAYPVTAATGDLLHISNSGAGTGVTYDIVILGTSS